MPFTISTQNGAKLLREHNVRDENIVRSQPHIDPHGKFEIWYDIPVKAAYEKFFGEAVKEYNERQSRGDRKISDYYEKIEKDEKKHPVYEMIITVGNIYNPIDPEIGYKILCQFAKEWDYRNPNLKMVGAYFHADEEGVPHVHIDYIPIAHGYKSGMHTQNSLKRALKEQGIPHQPHTTAQIVWQHRENRALEDICNNNGIEIVHPQAGKGVKHIQVEAHKTIERAKVKAEDIITSAMEEAEKIKNKAIENVHIKIEEYEAKLLALNKTYDSTVAKKFVGEFFMGIVSSLNSLEDWQPTPVKEKHDLVTLKSEDFHKLLHGYNAKKMVFKFEESILPEIREKAVDMEKAARVTAETNYNATEVSVDRRVRAAELELMRCNLKIDELEKQSERLRDLYHNARDELNSIMPVLNKFPGMWKKMREKAKRSIEIEEIYYDYPNEHLYKFEDKTYTRHQFLLEYKKEIQGKNIEGDKILLEGIEEDKLNEDNRENEEDLTYDR